MKTAEELLIERGKELFANRKQVEYADLQYADSLIKDIKNYPHVYVLDGKITSSRFQSSEDIMFKFHKSLSEFQKDFMQKYGFDKMHNMDIIKKNCRRINKSIR